MQPRTDQRLISSCFWLWSVLAFAFSGWTAQSIPPSKINFNRDIRPILSENCFFCHGADANKRKGKLRLDSPTEALPNGIIVPGQPEASEVIKRIFSLQDDERMPPPESNRRLSDEQKNTLRLWIQEGAHYDTHWAYKTHVRPDLPEVQRTTWPRNGIDYFILARLENIGLSPSPESSPTRLLRRVALDLTGLPPTPEQLIRWQREADPLATAADELLASPRLGERLASDWMDVSRYADTHGFNNDSMRSMWRWRDWVIDAFNRNLPYDQFITEQIAGDLLPNPTLDQLIATGFNRNHGINSEGGIIDEEYRVEYVADRIRTVSMAWLGLTAECARCHDHKFDPFTQRDYYRLFAFFNHVEEYGEDGRMANASPMIPTPTPEQQTLMTDHRATMAKAEAVMAQKESTTDWTKVVFDHKPHPDNELLALNTTNRTLAFNANSWSALDRLLTNAVPGSKPFQTVGNLHPTAGPGGLPAWEFDGSTHLKTERLPKLDPAKGWAFAAWIRRDSNGEAPLLSTMDFSVPESSQGYGQGVEIRLTAKGALDLRVAKRWPAYSLNVISRDTLPLGEWHHILVTSDGSENARGMHLFLDGQECFRTTVHDDLFGGVGPNGKALLGSSALTNAPSFSGALADVQLIAGPVNSLELAKEAKTAVLTLARATPVEQRLPIQTRQLCRAWLNARDPDFMRANESWFSARAALLQLEKDAPTTMIMREQAEPRPTFILRRGQYNAPTDPVTPGVPSALFPDFSETISPNRLGLARWLTHPKHPLTARVVVNRFWQSLFGTGLVKTVEDFGFQAEYPSHPELLDWLAVEFVESGWDLKALLRLMVTSATYRQDSRSTPELNERDPENRLLARGPRQRLTAEMLRDQALFLGGLLQERTGGPPAYPYQPTNLYQGVVVAANYPGTTYPQITGPDLYRRSLYTFWKRTVPHPTFTTFDASPREVCVARRLRTNTPLQALALMNDPVQVEAARTLGERMLTEGGSSPAERIAFAFTLATARRPEREELETLISLLRQRLAHYQSDAQTATEFLSVGSSQPKAGLDSAQLAAYANVASLILNLDETITRN